MPLVACKSSDRVKETTTTTGTGNITTAGAATGFETFNTAFGTDVRFFYAIVGASEWEVGQGYLSASTTLVRETVLQSSNADALVNFSSGTKDVFQTFPAKIADTVIPRGRVAALVNQNWMP